MLKITSTFIGSDLTKKLSVFYYKLYSFNRVFNLVLEGLGALALTIFPLGSIKINLGIYKNGDEDFFVWTEEVDANEQLNTESKELLENIINEHEQVIDIISFR